MSEVIKKIDEELRKFSIKQIEEMLEKIKQIECVINGEKQN